MSGPDTFLALTSANFSEIEIQGICGAAETEEILNGSMDLEFVFPETESTSESIRLDEFFLWFGEDEALLHNLAGFGAIGGSITANSGEKWSITLP